MTRRVTAQQQEIDTFVVQVATSNGADRCGNMHWPSAQSNKPRTNSGSSNDRAVETHRKAIMT